MTFEDRGKRREVDLNLNEQGEGIKAIYFFIEEI